MRKIIATIILLTLAAIVKSQNLPDSIVVIYSQYAPEWFDKGTIYLRDTTLIAKEGTDYMLLGNKINISRIKALCDEINNPLSLEESFYQTNIDTTVIKKNPLSLKKNYREHKYKWNKAQLAYISSELRSINNYIKQYNEYLNPCRGVSIPPYHENEIIIKCFKNGFLTDKLISNKSRPFRLYQFPWINTITNIEYYNVKLGEILLDILGLKNSSEDFIQGKKLLNYLSSKVIESNRKRLLELAAYTYQSEIDELEDIFTIVRARENSIYGGYTGGGDIIVLTLHNEKMLPNIFISLGLTKQEKTLYSRDPIKTDYMNLISKVQAIKFINNYLNENINRKLYIHYFNNKPINDYIYKHVMRTCVTQHLDEAITFELRNEDGDSSLWLLFPDGLVLLFRMDGEKVLEYPFTKFGDTKSNLYPCLRFDKNGNILNK